MNIKELVIRLKNPGTVVTLAALVCLLLTTLGVFDAAMGEKVQNIVQIVCSILVVLGIMNNPDTPGLDLPLLPKE